MGKRKRGGTGREGRGRTTFTHPLSQIPGYATGRTGVVFEIFG